MWYELSIKFIGTQRRVHLTGGRRRLQRGGSISGGYTIKMDQILSDGDERRHSRYREEEQKYAG